MPDCKEVNKMVRKQLQQFILETYGAYEEYPWNKYPNYVVFRHNSNHKWFALIMDISKEKLGFSERDPIDVLNVKCEPLIIGSLRGEPGIYPAYHMNKANWISIALDSSVSDERIKWLLDMSYDLTKTQSRKEREQHR